MPSSQRQEVFNVLLAQLLQERGAVVAPESIMYTGAQKARQMPDVIVNFQGLRTAIEGEVDAANAKDKAVASAMHRVETGVAHIGVGVVYPASLRAVEFSQLKSELAHAKLEIAVVTETGSSGFVSGDVDHLERTLRSTFEQLIKEDIVAEAVALIDAAVDRFAIPALDYRGIWGRIIDSLGGPTDEKVQEKLTALERGAFVRVGGLIVLNAMIFHDVLATNHKKLTRLVDITPKMSLLLFPEQWEYILDNINYYSIFHLARRIFNDFGTSAWGTQEALRFMVKTALKISEQRAALRHDLMGRVYHRLLADAKYLGTYYTSIPAATLLLKLALRPTGWSFQWDDAKKLQDLRIADLACGTGTLLMAAADTILDNHVSATSATGKRVQLNAIHQEIAESILYGYDVLASAIHLTASTLALRSPDVPFKKMNLFAMPYGGKDDRLGSIEFLSGNLAQISMDFAGAIDQAQQVTGRGVEGQYITLPDLDLCVMNPPFVRSVGGNLLFGSMAEKQRSKMQTRLKKLVKNVQASVTSGLGSVFVALGDKHIKPEGRLALVLPKALLSGVSWQETRNLVNRNYRIDYIVVSHDAERWNFSDSTDLSEALLVATKNQSTKQPNGHYTTIVNLWRNPTTAIEGLNLAAQIMNAQPTDLLTGQGATNLMLNGKKAGEMIAYDWKQMQLDWFLPCAFAQVDLTRAVSHLIQGEVWIPTVKGKISINLCTLGDLGRLGPDRRDIYDGFEPVDSPTSYPAFWGHDADKVIQLGQETNKYLSPLAQAKKGRPLRKVEDLWGLSGTIVLAERMWLRTQRLVAMRLNKAALSNVWWSFAFKENVTQVDADKALVLWLNSTFAFLILLSTRDETRGAWVDFKKPSLTAMPVLDIRALTPEQLVKLAAAFDSFSTQPLKPLPQMAEDETRAAIDAAIADALGLPDVSPLRIMLAREPVVCMKRI